MIKKFVLTCILAFVLKTKVYKIIAFLLKINISQLRGLCVCMFGFETKIVKKGMFIKIQNKKSWI